MDRGEGVVAALVVSRGDCPEVFAFVEKPLDKITCLVETRSDEESIIWMSPS